MAVGSDELEKLSDDIYRERRIIGSVFCGKCGYNLRTLPYVHTCPECGNEFNARPLHLTGIFQLYEAEFPFRDAASTVVCALGAVVLGLGAFKPPDPPDLIRLVITAFFILCMMVFARLTFLAGRRYLLAWRIIRRIKLERDEDD